MRRGAASVHVHPKDHLQHQHDREPAGDIATSASHAARRLARARMKNVSTRATFAISRPASAVMRAARPAREADDHQLRAVSATSARNTGASAGVRPRRGAGAVVARHRGGHR